MVQEAGLDLIRPALVAGLSALLLAVPAAAQPLLPNPPLTTLLRPQPLDRSRPLLPQAAPAPSRQAGQGPAGSPCERPAGSASTAAGAASGAPLVGQVPPAPRAAYGGAGPGEYARFLPDAPAAAAPGSSAQARPATPPTVAGVGVDRPLYGGTNRPLWNTGERRPPSQPGAAKASASDAAKSAGPDAPTEPGATETAGAGLPDMPRDRPLWADPLAAAPLATGTSPCIPAAR